jgi:hypothetical protein
MRNDSHPKRPRDPSQLAQGTATRPHCNPMPENEGKDPAAELLERARCGVAPFVPGTGEALGDVLIAQRILMDRGILPQSK